MVLSIGVVRCREASDPLLGGVGTVAPAISGLTSLLGKGQVTAVRRGVLLIAVSGPRSLPRYRRPHQIPRPHQHRVLVISQIR